MAKDYFGEDILDDALSTRQKERKEKRAPKLQKKQQLEKEKALAASENKVKRRKFLVIVIAVLLILVALFGKSFYQIYELKKEKNEAQKQLDGINDDIGRLEEELKRVSDPEYIIQEARNRLRMIFPGEKLYIVREGEDSKK